ncbi:MAG: ATPase P [Acidobacteria bacterium]|nr:ATPase P [Bacteroidota bacterium]MBS1766480.1 ATPase P [Acidobacteriota bacterium]
MMRIAIPGHPGLELDHLILDFNGTLAVDGVLLDGVADRMRRLAKALEIHVITGDTHGTASAQLQSLPCRVEILAALHQAEAKQTRIRDLGPQHCAAIGNGRNDRFLLREAALGIATIQMEGAAMDTLREADVVAPDIHAALDLLLHPTRLVASLRT